jgi:hypothetical protein
MCLQQCIYNPSEGCEAVDNSACEPGLHVTLLVGLTIHATTGMNPATLENVKDLTKEDDSAGKIDKAAWIIM